MYKLTFKSPYTQKRVSKEFRTYKAAKKRKERILSYKGPKCNPRISWRLNKK